MTDELDELRALSARIGGDPLLVQGAGGNASIKLGDTLWVKASGTWLAEAVRREIFLPLHLDRILSDIAAGAADPVTPHLRADGALRPSIEASLHALMPHRVVIHAHAVASLAWAIRRDAPGCLAPRLDGLCWSWVPYHRPGVPLMGAVAERLGEAPDVLILANHGVIVGAPSCEAAESRLRAVERRLEVEVAPDMARTPDRGELAHLGARIGFGVEVDQDLHALARRRVSLRVLRGGALCPDQVVFLGPAAPVIAPDEDLKVALEAYRSRYGIVPDHLVVEGLGVVAGPRLSRGAVEMLRCLALTLARFPDGAEPQYLGDGDVAALLGWEAEAYRRAIDRPAAG